MLVVDDDPALTELVATTLSASGYETVSARSVTEALEQAATRSFAAVVTDIQMPGQNGLDLCKRLVGGQPGLPVIVMTGFGSMELAIAALRAGAYDFLTKPLNTDVLVAAVARAVEASSLRAEVKRLRHAVVDSHTFDELIGDSPPMRRLFELIERIAATDTTVLITGESGTGKELVARALHRRSRRAVRPFVALNCSAVPAGLMESELFGHAKGAFTDARSSHSGLFVQADGGTLFLDELGELPLPLQPKLLRALEERTVRPVGGTAEVPYDVRLVCATNRDLETAVEDGRFREDLYYRINVIHVPIPPLRERGRDILLLAQHYIDRFAATPGNEVVGPTTSAAERLLTYAWPGNVRELRNAIESATALARHDRITLDDLPERIRRFRPTELVVPLDDTQSLQTMEEVERRYILRVLETLAGNKRQAARVLGFDRRTLYRKLERYGVATESDTDP